MKKIQAARKAKSKPENIERTMRKGSSQRARQREIEIKLAPLNEELLADPYKALSKYSQKEINEDPYLKALQQRMKAEQAAKKSSLSNKEAYKKWVRPISRGEQVDFFPDDYRLLGSLITGGEHITVNDKEVQWVGWIGNDKETTYYYQDEEKETLTIPPREFIRENKHYLSELLEDEIGYASKLISASNNKPSSSTVIIKRKMSELKELLAKINRVNIIK